MFRTIDETIKLIESGKWLHISGSEGLFGKLPRGNWIGGSTEYFMTESGGKVANNMLFVEAFPYDGCIIAEYDEAGLENITKDAFDNGFSVLVLPFDSNVHISYSKNAHSYENMFHKNITGWISGVNLCAQWQKPVAVNGLTGERHTDRAVAIHVPVKDDEIASIGIINIFESKSDGPVIEFSEEGFAISKCRVDGVERVLADYISENDIDTKLPLIGDYSGAGVNVSIKQIADGIVNLYAPVFSGIKYSLAKGVACYAEEFKNRLSQYRDSGYIFSCNCILNFLYGDLEGKRIDTFYGPITFGEIAYQLVNQTLVYVQVCKR